MKVCAAWMPAKWYSAASDFIIMPPLPLTLSPAPSPFLVIFVNVTVTAFTLLLVTPARMGSQSPVHCEVLHVQEEGYLPTGTRRILFISKHKVD